MKICLINGSPKLKESASLKLMNDFAKYLDGNQLAEIEAHKNKLTDEQLVTLKNSDALVFFFPLYIDGIPAHLLSCLCQLETFFLKQPYKTSIYGVSNNGFFEGAQNHHALKILEHWCEKCRLTWGQGVGIGSGGMILAMKNLPPGKGPKKNLGKAFEQLSVNILNKKSAPNIYINFNYPRFLYKLMAEMSWRKQAKGNRLKKEQLGKPY